MFITLKINGAAEEVNLEQIKTVSVRTEFIYPRTLDEAGNDITRPPEPAHVMVNMGDGLTLRIEDPKSMTALMEYVDRKKKPRTRED